MAINLDFSVQSDIDPYVPSVGISSVYSQFKIVSGTLRANFNNGPISLLRTTTASTGLVDVVFTTNQAYTDDSDNVGAYFGNLSGTGVVVRVYYDLIAISYITSGSLGTTVSQSSGQVFSPGTTFRATYNTATNVVEVFEQSAPTTAILSSVVTAPSEVGAGLYINWDGNGNAGVISATLSSATSATIDSYPVSVRSGQIGIAYATTGLSSVSAITVGSLSGTSLSDTSGDGTHALPGLVDTVAHQLYGTKTVTITGVGGTPTTTTAFLPPTGWDYVTLSGTLNTTTTGVLNSFSPAAVVTDQIVFETSKATVDAQGNILSDYDGTQTMWHIQASTGIARSYLVVTSLEVSASTNKITGSKITGSRITGSKITGLKI